METLWWELNALYYPFMVQFRTIFPFWVIGLSLSALITAYGSKTIENLAGRLGKGRLQILYIILASLLGIISPLCMYGTVPLIALLAKKGIPQGILAAFMISSILLNPTLLFMTLALGPNIAILRFILALLAGVLAGLLVTVFYQKRTLFYIESFEEDGTKKALRTRFKQFLHSLRRNFEITAPYFLFGITLTVVLQRYIPTDLFTRILGNESPYAVLVSASIGVPLYMCGGGTVPLIQAWLQSGMSTGAALAFMLSGPATKLNNLSAVKVILGKFNFVLYLIYTLSFSLISGYVLDWFFR